MDETQDTKNENNMSDAQTQEKVKELVELMHQFNDENPLSLPAKKNDGANDDTSTDFTVIETGHTISYSQKEQKHYGKLVGYTQ